MLSIIIPTYNEEKYLPLLLASIERQDIDDYEVIVADNKSRDKTRSIARKHGCRIVEGGKVARGRNNGAKAAKGDMLLFMDADVVLPEDFLSSLLEIVEDEGLDLCSTTWRPISNRRTDRLGAWIFRKLYLLIRPLQINCFGSCILVKRPIFEKTRFDESLFLAEDHEFARRGSRIGKYKLIDLPVNVSVRRFDKEGRIRLLFKYLKITIYSLFHPRIEKEIIEYDFKH